MTTRKPRGVGDATTTRINIRIPTQVYQRLMVTSVMSKQAPGSIVADLITDHLKGWSMPGKLSDRRHPNNSADPAVELDPAAAAAA